MFRARRIGSAQRMDIGRMSIELPAMDDGTMRKINYKVREHSVGKVHL